MASIEEILGNCKDIYPIDLLDKLHTKQLLMLLRQARLNPYCSCGSPGCTHDSEIFGVSLERVSIDNIRTVLSTREHVLSKSESKAARIARIKKGR